MATTLQSATTYYQSYEKREAAFSRVMAGLIPCKYAGPQRFWIEFNRIANEGFSHLDQHKTAYITSNPRDCLAFGSARQVLSAAFLTAGNNHLPTPDVIESQADKFELMHALDQPIRTLSGGETVKLALAKVDVLSTTSRRLAIASPFSWLSLENRPLLDRVIGTYFQKDLGVNIHALNGEDDESPVAADCLNHANSHAIPFSIRFTGVRVGLGAMISTVGTTPAHARIENIEADLHSPCLLSGNNGQGKSLVAKTLGNAVAASGKAVIASAAGDGVSRLLFQDVITQALTRPISALSKPRVADDGNTVLKVVEDIRHTFEFMMSVIPGEHRQIPGKRTPAKDSLLDLKMILAASRLCTLPPAFIMDEPDWGLTRATAISLVIAIIKTAHDLKVPVLLISHKPWWRPIARSILRVTKTADPAGGENGCRFSIVLTPEQV
ncbi:MAG: hypothetical protein HKM93_12000 [Desulfobacteraceae bacterium]|nr:hypothetical protein [Desulfobacteraceae bacterium]